MTKEEFASKLEALLLQYTNRSWSAWVVFGQAPNAEGDQDIVVLSGICPEDLPRAFKEVSESINQQGFDEVQTLPGGSKLN